MATDTSPSNFVPIFYSEAFADPILNYKSKTTPLNSSATPCVTMVFDGSSSGCMDHFMLYIPGAGGCHIFRWAADKETFQPIYTSDNAGIGGFDLASARDRIRAYDYNHSGKNDHLFCYRPATGRVVILSHDGQGNFTPVYDMPDAEIPSVSAGSGIGGCMFRWPWDRVFMFDYDHSKKLDYICVYQRHETMSYSLGHRTGENTWSDPQNSDLLGHSVKFHIIKHGENDRFYMVYRNIYGGIGGYDMGQGNGSEADYAFAYDWEGSGCQDYILFLNHSWSTPRMQTKITLIKHQGDKFVTTYKTDKGYTPKFQESVYPFYFPFDFESSGKLDHFGVWAPEAGTMWFMKSPIQEDTAIVLNGKGLGAFQFKNQDDRLFPFDFDGSGCQDHILVVRPGGKHAVWLFKRRGHVPRPRIQQQWSETPQVPSTWPNWEVPQNQVPPGVW